ncbi:MAG TPA: GtrA family protein [Candidatus Saccharimonadales bacterium]|nr:GtrA family protein [Candidatus Saccharimonadales bacterium]
MLKKLWNYKKIRYLCVGSFNSLADLTILNTLVFVGHFPVWLANVVSVSVGITLSYFLNHFIVFRHEHSPNPKLFAKFFIATGIGVILIQTIVIYFTRPLYTHLIQHTHQLSLIKIESKVSLNLAKVTAILIGMVWNYMFYSRVVFKKSPVDSEAKDIAKIV